MRRDSEPSLLLKATEMVDSVFQGSKAATRFSRQAGESEICHCGELGSTEITSMWHLEVNEAGWSSYEAFLKVWADTATP